MGNPIEGLRAALTEIPDGADVLVVDETGGLFRLQEVAGVVGDGGPVLVLTVKKVGQDPAVDGWTGVADLPV